MIKELIEELKTVLQLSETDIIIFFRYLANYKRDNISDGVLVVTEVFYRPDEIIGDIEAKWYLWYSKYRERLKKEQPDDRERAEHMNAVNPKYVLRNYMAQLAIDAAEEDDYSVIDKFSIC